MSSTSSKLVKIGLRLTLRPLLKHTSLDQQVKLSIRESTRPVDYTHLRLPGGAKAQPLTVSGVPAEWITAPDSQPERVMLYIHGGGWVVGSISSHRHLIARLAQSCRMRLLAINYRLAPAHPYPAALEDCLAAYRWLLVQGVDPHQLVVAGDSAGGNLTLTTLLALRQAGDPLPAAAVCLSPATDLSTAIRPEDARKDPLLDPGAGQRWLEAYLAGQDPAQPLVSPLFGDLHGLPPILIQIGTDEMLYPDAIRFSEKARQSGVDLTLDIWEGMFHVWQLSAPLLPEANQAIRKIGEYVQGKVNFHVATAKIQERP